MDAGLKGDLDTFSEVGRHIEILAFEEVAVCLVEKTTALDLAKEKLILIGLRFGLWRKRCFFNFGNRYGRLPQDYPVS